MKRKEILAGIFGITLFFGLPSAQAQIVEFQCQDSFGRPNGVQTHFEISRAFPRSALGDVRMQESTPRGTMTSGFQVTGRRSNGLNQIRLMGAGINLDIELGMDRFLRRGQYYRTHANYLSRLLNRYVSDTFDCQYIGY